MSSSILQTVPLGFQWPTVDPFLFCVHHLDHYPAADGELGPAASLDGRSIGNDFEPVDGWRMYHGAHVPGFPQHPHRGFETITFVRRGLIDHSDSLGATARYGRGDVQWMTAGGGIQHAEMFPLLDDDEPNTMEMFQIWMNLPAQDKMVEPHFSMLWDHDIPRHVVTRPGAGPDSPTVTVTVVAGELADHVPPSPPPSSWAARPDSDVALWHVVFEPGSSWEMPAASGADTVRVLYVFDGDGLTVDQTPIDTATGAVVDSQRSLTLGASGHVELLVMQGRPIGEPVAQQGPFVMNTEVEIRQAFDDYRRTQFGGWPWDSPDPTHGHDGERFARHADGRVEHVASLLPTTRRSSRVRWSGRTRFLTDALTYSASEDAILGLGQLPDVDVVGQPSGAGSGRPRTIALHGTAVLTVSTALTYDHQGRCVEGTGIALDHQLPAEHGTPHHADHDW